MELKRTKYRKYYAPDRKDLSHWLSGIVRCEKCGAVLSNQGGFFGCSNRCRGLCDGVGYIKAEKIAKIILDILSDMELPNVELNFAEPEEEAKLDRKEPRRLTEVLKDADVSNMEKNNMARTIFKEIIKGGDGGKRLKCVFWRH